MGGTMAIDAEIVKVTITGMAETFFHGRPNGLAQRQRRDWRDALPIMAYSGKSRLRGAAEPLSDWSRC
jgi:hypothetical protein